MSETEGREEAGSGVLLLTEAVEASPEGAANYLRSLADRIESADGYEVLIGVWNTGFGAPSEFCFQAVIDSEPASGPMETPQEEPKP